MHFSGQMLHRAKITMHNDLLCFVSIDFDDLILRLLTYAWNLEADEWLLSVLRLYQYGKRCD